MIFVVAYDIPDDRVRNRVAAALLDFGERVQESVFECRTDTAGLDELVAHLRLELSVEDSGGIRIYRLCEECYRRSIGLGELASAHHSEPFIVMDAFLVESLP